jgi:DNA-binding transcriptional MerR regulator
MSDIQNISRTLETIAPYLQLSPNGADNFNVDNIIRIVASTLGFPVEGIRSANEVLQKRQQEQEMQQQQMESQQQAQQMQGAQMGAETMKTMQSVQGAQ